MKLTQLRLKEWSEIQSHTKALFEKNVLGKRPTFDEVKASIPNQHQITLLEWLAVVVLVVLTLFTSYKVGALAVPFATETLQRLGDHTYISDVVQLTFTAVTAFLFMLLATPSILYFKLLSGEPEVTAEKKATQYTRWHSRWSLEYLTPRLPAMVVYLSVAWLVLISSQLPGSVFEQYLPVVVEVALAALVGNILNKRKNFNRVVYDALKERTVPYDQRKANYERDEQYLRLLYQVMREYCINMQRPVPGQKRAEKVNAWIEDATDAEARAVLFAEYRRLTAGDGFAQAIIHTAKGTDPVVVEPTQDLHGAVATQLRRPPIGDNVWTPESLAHDLRVAGYDAAEVNESTLSQNYDSAYKVRKAWRNGGRELFQAKE